MAGFSLSPTPASRLPHSAQVGRALHDLSPLCATTTAMAHHRRLSRDGRFAVSLGRSDNHSRKTWRRNRSTSETVHMVSKRAEPWQAPPTRARGTQSRRAGTRASSRQAFCAPAQRGRPTQGGVRSLWCHQSRGFSTIYDLPACSRSTLQGPKRRAMTRQRQQTHTGREKRNAYRRGAWRSRGGRSALPASPPDLRAASVLLLRPGQPPRPASLRGPPAATRGAALRRLPSSSPGPCHADF